MEIIKNAIKFFIFFQHFRLLIRSIYVKGIPETKIEPEGRRNRD